MTSLIPQLVSYLSLGLEDISIFISFIFFLSITMFISFIIGKYGMDSLLYILRKKKIITENLKIDSRFFKKQQLRIKELEDEIKILKNKVSSQDTYIQVMKEA